MLEGSEICSDSVNIFLFDQFWFFLYVFAVKECSFFSCGLEIIEIELRSEKEKLRWVKFCLLDTGAMCVPTSSIR